MNIEELRKALSSDATERCKAQEETIKKLHAEIKEMRDRLNEAEKGKQQLMSRCFEQTRGFMCIFCGFSNECEAQKKHAKT